MSWSSQRIVLAVAAGCLVAGCGGSSTNASRVAGPAPHRSMPETHAHQSRSPATPGSAPASAAPPRAGRSVPTGVHSAATTATTGGTKTSPTRSDVVALLAPGTYDYRVTGSSRSALGSKNYNGTSTLRVDSPQGDRQHTKQQDEDGSTEQVLVAA